ncbi:MAG: ThiF family adenylyltransferase, partial [Saprospiraceae bacterium]|nr:ThiF family adenylyltransferase [Saprospiraceae bacterium]
MATTTLTDETWKRYLRQFSLQGWGLETYELLKGKKVLVLGAGGIGSTLLPYLAGAGVGAITVADGDRIELSNLHRQVLYTAEDIGMLKA